MLWTLLRSAFRPQASANPLVERSLLLRRSGRLRDAEITLRDAALNFPDDPVVATNLGVILLEQDAGDEGVKWLQRALALDARCAPAHYNLANFMRAAGRREEAASHYQHAVDADPTFAPARGELMTCLLELCEWDRADVGADALRAIVEKDPSSSWMRYIAPLTAVYLRLATDLRKALGAYHAAEYARGVQTLATRSSADGNPRKLHIAYLSRDFRDHPVGHLLGNVFALHDRSQFEVFAFSCGPDDASIYRKSIVASVDHYVDAHAMTDDELASDIAQRGIHILIDLAGHTTGNRLAVLARRPAPVQAHYLGFPATTGAPYVDYFITDHIVTPPELAYEFSETLMYMPRCFMVSDGTDASGVSASRPHENLPAEAVVFCNFNTASRITRDDFHLWMEVLRGVPHSVIWLLGQSGQVVANLRREAELCGIRSDRLTFAQRTAEKRQHLARLCMADLMLDTIGWHNGHSSTSDALWAGVPVLTAPNRQFAGRVAASLVTAAGLPELVTISRDEYLRIAVELGNDRVTLTSLKRKLVDAKRTAPFFDTQATVRDLESLYHAMWSQHKTAQSRISGDYNNLVVTTDKADQ